MTAINYRATVVAIKKETTEGTPVLPAAATDYIPIHDDFELVPEVVLLENAELKNSLGTAKGIRAGERPTANFSLYLKHSGTSGTAPNYGHLLEAAFGSVDDSGVEHNTVASSTTSVINVDTGEGATYQKGQILLIQDGTNGYNIRPVYSISSDALTMLFNVGTAPAAGVDLGEAIMYRPATSGHPSLSLWEYMGNGGNVQGMAGARVTEVSLEFSANELITMGIQTEGLKYYYNPIEITSSTKYLDFNDGSDRAAQVTAQVYQTPHELADALETAMNALSSDTITVSYSDTTGKYTIASTGGTFNLEWNTGTNTANTIGTKLGFLVAADDSGSQTYTSDNAITLTATHTPDFDNADPLVAKANEVLIGDATSTTSIHASSVSVTISTPKADILSVTSTSGLAGSVIASRECEIEVTALLDQYDADKINRLLNNTDTRFMYAFGEKSGGNWVKGKCGALVAPTCTVSSFSRSNQDGLVAVTFGVKPFVNDSGDPEILLGFV